jgi:predicted porin
MKKTIIASAVAATFAAPVAFADVTISGQINQEFHSVGSADLNSGNNTDLVFSGSEDLGNGMKAFFKIHRYFDDQDTASTTALTSTATTGTAAASSTATASSASGHTHAVTGSVTSGAGTGATSMGAAADQIVGLSGDFGTIQVGRFEPYTEASIAAVANIDASEDTDIENALTTANTGRSDGGVAYTSPNFNGVTVGIQGFTEAGATGDDFGSTTVWAQYSNGGLTVRAASEDNGSGNTDMDSLAAIYKMDGLEVRLVATDDGTNTNQFYGASYTMGANKIAAGKVSSDATGSDDSILSLSHSLSKSTSVYVVQKNDDNGDNSTLVGMKHSF